MTTKNSGYSVGTTILVFALAFSGEAAEYRIGPARSTYAYLVPPEGPGIPGCQSGDFRCDFEIAGTVDFDVDLIAGRGMFVGADLQLNGNENTSAGPGFPQNRADVLELFLVNLGSIPLESAAGGVLLFREPILTPPAIRRNSLEVVISGNHLSLTGAYDRTFVDADGHGFHVGATLVPEASTAALMLCGIAAAVWKLRHRKPMRRIYQR